ncbi:MAG: AraC family ligand binding domain-containing protein, partial [Eubacterium sp.]|nr:AraC family ligand binding domain-containing protein [Eubacterium sp.]
MIKMYFYEQKRSNERNYLFCQADTNFSFPLHLHRSFEFIYVEDGNMNIQIGNQNYSLQKNKAALIFPGQLHAYTTTEYSKSFLCIFSADYVYDFYNLIKGKIAENPTFPFNSSDCIEQLKCSNSFNVKSALYNIAGQFINNCNLTDTADDNLELLEKIISYIQKHFNEQISLRQLAKKLGYHYNYISSYI